MLTVKCGGGELYFRWTGLPSHDLFFFFLFFKNVFRPVSHLLKATMFKLSGKLGLPASFLSLSFTFPLKTRDSLLQGAAS